MEEAIANQNHVASLKALNLISINSAYVDGILSEAFEGAPTFSETFPWLFAPNNGQGETGARRKGRSILLSNLADISCSFERYSRKQDENLAERILNGLRMEVTDESENIFWLVSYLIRVWKSISSRLNRETRDNIFAFLTRFRIQNTKVAMIFNMPSGSSQTCGWALHEATNTDTTKEVVRFLEEEYSLLHQYNGKISYSLQYIQRLRDTCNFDAWIDQGVLLFNSKLTYKDDIWIHFTDAVVRQLNKTCDHLAFMLAGNVAQKKFFKINDFQKKHFVIKLYHPTANEQKQANKRWKNALPFMHANLFLHQNNIEMINWADTSSASMESQKSFFDDVISASTDAVNG